MVVDLLADGGVFAQRVLAEDQPAMSKDEYLEQQLRIFRREMYDPTQSF